MIPATCTYKQSYHHHPPRRRHWSFQPDICYFSSPITIYLHIYLLPANCPACTACTAGALTVVAADGGAARRVESQLRGAIIRPMYSSPPAHGAAIAAKVLGDPELMREWKVRVIETEWASQVQCSQLLGCTYLIWCTCSSPAGASAALTAFMAACPLLRPNPPAPASSAALLLTSAVLVCNHTYPPYICAKHTV